MPLLWRGKGSSFLPGEEAGAEAGRLHQQWPHRPGLSTVTSNNRIPVMSGRRKTSWILFRYVLGWSNEQPEESWGWRKRRKADFRNVLCKRNCVWTNQGPWRVCSPNNTIETAVGRKMVDKCHKTKGLHRYSDAIFTLFLSHSKSCLSGNHFLLRERTKQSSFCNISSLHTPKKKKKQIDLKKKKRKIQKRQ